MLLELGSLYVLAAVFLAVAAGAFLKGVTGVGLPVIAVPVMASVTSVDHAVAVMIIPAFVSNLFLVWHLRREAAANAELLIFAVLGICGIFLGGWILTAINRELTFLLLGGWVGVYLLIRARAPVKTIGDERATKLAVPVGFTAGVFQGSTGISFPVFGPYWQARQFNRDRFAFNSAALLMVFSVVQFASFTNLGLLTPARISAGALALLPMALALPIGIKFAGRIDQKKFERLIVAILVITAVSLIARGLVGW